MSKKARKEERGLASVKRAQLLNDKIKLENEALQLKIVMDNEERRLENERQTLVNEALRLKNLKEKILIKKELSDLIQKDKENETHFYSDNDLP